MIIGVALLLMGTKCTQTKLLTQTIEPPVFDIEIINAYLQKNVPGEVTQKPYYEFGFEVKGLDGKTVIDSVFCGVGKALKINTNEKQTLRLSINNKTNYRKAVFFFSQKEHEKTYILNTIKTKETIHLP